MTDKSKNLIAIYEQYWLNARENENHRLWFTNIYVLITAGVLALIGSRSNDSMSLLFSIFLLILSVIGLFVSYRYTLSFMWQTRMSEKILYDWDLGEEYSHTFGKNAVPKITNKRVSIGRLYTYFYALMIGVITSLAIWKSIEALNFDKNLEYWISLATGCFSTLLAVIIYFKYLRKDMLKIQGHFKNIIGNSNIKR